MNFIEFNYPADWEKKGWVTDSTPIIFVTSMEVDNA